MKGVGDLAGLDLMTAPTASQQEALEKLVQALEAARRAKRAKFDVSEAKRLLKHARVAFERGDYATAVQIAGEILRLFGSLPPRAA